MYDFGGRECPHCHRIIQVFRGVFRWHGPRYDRCPGSGQVYEPANTACSGRLSPDPITRDWDNEAEDKAWAYLKKRRR